MDVMPVGLTRCATALNVHRAGYQVVPLAEGGKGLAYKGATALNRAGIVEHWGVSPDSNIGVLLTGTRIAVIDIDGPEAEEFVSEHGLESNTVVRSPSGGRHLYFKHMIEDPRTRIRFLGLPLDVKLTGHMVWAHSTFRGKVYELLAGPRPVKLLPELPESVQQLIRAELHKTVAPAPLPPLARIEGDDARMLEAYIDTFDVAVQGQGGSKVCFCAMLKILTRVGGDVDRAWPLAVRYSRRCEPPWDEEADDGPNSLRRKLREAAKVWHPR